MKRIDLVNVLDGLDDGQEDCEPVACALPGLTAGDARYLRMLVERDIQNNPPPASVAAA